MGRAAIKVENLSKQYAVGSGASAHDTLYDLLTHAASAPFRRTRAGRDTAPATDFWALRNVTFSAEEGEVIGVVGRNGAGKSTLLKILSRITAPTTGRIEVRGRLASLLEVGTGFHPELSGRENIYLNGAILGMSRREVARKFDQIVAFAETETFIDTPVKRYSSGMYVRLAFAVAAYLEADVLVVDEVLAVGDQGFQQKCIGKMRDIASKGRTVFFVSHNLAAIASLCTRSLLMNKGTIAMDDRTQSVLSAYANQFTSHESTNPIVFEADDASSSPVEVERIELLDAHGNYMPSLSTWDFVRFRVCLRSDKFIPGASIALQVSTPEGTALLLTSTMPDQRLEVDIPAGSSHYDCVFPSFPLAAGSFRIGVGVAIPHVRWLLNRLDQGGRLEVMPRDVYLSGYAPSSDRYQVAVKHHWEAAMPSRERQ
jgi:lipopolysaccharide transport system ATP-binding protein